MFSPSISNHEHTKTFNHVSDSNDAELWKGIFINSLRKVLEQIHPSLTARDDALDYVENLIIQLLGMLCQKPSPHCISDVEERVRTTFPTSIDKWALDSAKETLERYRRRGDHLVLPVEKIHQMLQKEILQYKLDIQVIVFISAVLEYISADIFKLTGNYVKNIHHVEITCQDIRVAMCADKVLTDMFTHQGSEHVNESDINLENSSYESAVKDFIHDERQHLRNLNMIRKVFLDEIRNLLTEHELNTLQSMFQNLCDISDLTSSIIASFEDILEMNEDNQLPLIGGCLQEFAEELEFDVYSRFTNDIIQTNGPEHIIELLSINNRLDILTSAGQGFREAVKYYFPKLLRYPIWHCFSYFEYIKIFQEVSEDVDDKKNLEQLEGILKPLQTEMSSLLAESLPKNEKEYGTHLHAKMSHTILMEKVDEMLKSVDGFMTKYSTQYCKEFLREDVIKVQSTSKRQAERRATLFDGMLVLSKRKRLSSTSGPNGGSGGSLEYKLKDIVFIRKIEIKDRADTDELKNSIEIVPREQPPFLCVFNSCEEKCSWMSDLIMLNIKWMLDRSLSSVLDDIEKKNSLQMPPVELYRFAEPDSPSNIVFEGSTLKGGTLLKLVERLTYHVYTDAVFDKAFLITYRTFTTSHGLLDLLIERYHIPDIQLFNTPINLRKEDINRYRKKYCQPIQFRVLNVLKRCVDCYFYELSEDELLLEKIKGFLNSIIENTQSLEKSMRKWAICVTKILERKLVQDPTEIGKGKIYDFDRDPPPIEWHIIDPEKDTEAAWKEWNINRLDDDGRLCVGWRLLALHPVEIARQMTLIEYDMYKAVKSTELIGGKYSKDKKEELAPNVTKISRSTTNFTLWLEKTIVETENLEERIAIMSRLLEIMYVLIDLNNFNGAFSIYTAFQSAAVFRLHYALVKIPRGLDKIYREVCDLCSDKYKKYIEKLHNLNPPCVPFCGNFLTKLTYVEEGIPEYLNEKGCNIINFSKRKLISELIGDILRFQDQPYCLMSEPNIREFLEGMFHSSPFDICEADAMNYLYQQSLKIEPKDSVRKPLLVPKKWPDLNLKSPGIKLRNSSSHSSQSFRIPKPFLPSDDFFGIVSSPHPVGNWKSKWSRTAGSIIPVSSSGPVSPSRDSATVPNMFFESDLAGIGNANLPEQVSNSLDKSVEGPPLPPRVFNNSMLPPRDVSPPPLPPRKDSLHVRQISADSSSRNIMTLDSLSPFILPMNNPYSPINYPSSPGSQKSMSRFDFSTSSISPFNGPSEFDFFDTPTSPSSAISHYRNSDLMDLEDPVTARNSCFDEPIADVSFGEVSYSSSRYLTEANSWTSKTFSSTDKIPTNNEIPKKIIFKQCMSPLFHFNVTDK